jgi:hypothetical protein
MRIVLYTCVFGLYDKLPSHWLIPDIEFTCLSANDTAYNRIEASRYYKMMPHLIQGFKDYDTSIYADGNFMVTDPEKLRWLCETLWDAPESAIFFRHPDRQTPNQELREVIRRGIVSEIEGNAAEKKMFDNGFDGKQPNLTENGFMIRKHNDPDLQKCELFWWNEFMHGPRRDQISFQYAMFKTGYTNYRLMTCAEKLSMVKIKRHGE